MSEAVKPDSDIPRSQAASQKRKTAAGADDAALEKKARKSDEKNEHKCFWRLFEKPGAVCFYGCCDDSSMGFIWKCGAMHTKRNETCSIVPEPNSATLFFCGEHRNGEPEPPAVPTHCEGCGCKFAKPEDAKRLLMYDSSSGKEMYSMRYVCADVYAKLSTKWKRKAPFPEHPPQWCAKCCVPVHLGWLPPDEETKPLKCPQCEGALTDLTE